MPPWVILIIRQIKTQNDLRQLSLPANYGSLFAKNSDPVYFNTGILKINGDFIFCYCPIFL